MVVLLVFPIQRADDQRSSVVSANAIARTKIGQEAPREGTVGESENVGTIISHVVEGNYHEPQNLGRFPLGVEGLARTGVGIHQRLRGTQFPSSALSPRIHSRGINRPLPSGLCFPYTLPDPIQSCLPPLLPSSAGLRRCTGYPEWYYSGKNLSGLSGSFCWVSP